MATSSFSRQRSADNGASFQRYDQFRNTIISSMAIHSLSPMQLILISKSAKQIYYSSDAGTTFSNAVKLPFTPSKIVYCNDNSSSNLLGYDAVTTTLYLSKDNGATWNLLRKSVSSSFFWALPTFDSDLTTIYYEVLLKVGSKTVARVIAHSISKGIKRIFDASMGYTVKGSLVVSNNYIFSMKVKSFVNSTEELLLVSYKRNKFIHAKFPVLDLRRGFLLVYTDDNEVVIAVNHALNLTNVYVSDETGVYYGLAIERIRTSHDFTWLFGSPSVQFRKISSMPGTYIAAQLSNGRSPRPVTKISYDKGAKWHHVVAPKKDRNGNSINCIAPSCSLHLQFYSRYSFYSSSTSPGLVIGFGNWGSYFGQRLSSMFISDDGGYTWKEMPFRNAYFTALDHGSVIVAAGYDEIASGTFISYSCDGGSSWKKLTFSNERIRITGLVVEPGFTSLFATVYGTKVSNEWVLARLNFTSVLARRCQVSDYRVWIPRNPYTYANCTVGVFMAYHVRKPESCCYNGQTFVRPTTSTRCPCSREDFECNYGFIPTAHDCSVVSVDQKECDDGANFYYTSKYRKIPGNQCISGVENKLLEKIRYPCSIAFTPAPNSNGSSMALAIVLPVAVIVIVLIGLVYCKYRRTNEPFLSAIRLRRTVSNPIEALVEDDACEEYSSKPSSVV
ncbi:uncharacterized protein TRIADDRAFT_58580 [Trichoplax adhaerens]|uniref:VPS10 domain-containing protein n=1 Tax=Trichoplax adhaerens TaxID=10228 RepID=B3S336_TRIAD|nr:hypothetical protein TRIADDRAFT_58580 [Trichoplax adhaerens]EDV22898.1 hypothetical protein TRIADDRAFT_58580 [Trichoplax adhaerens]|eukprot:XP_002114764.1 hypothetical protein TRIADDRAFT_58580 [Trichoplax adhaerens]